MNKEEQDIALITAWLAEELNEAEEAAFAERLTDPDFKELLQTYMVMAGSLQQVDQQMAREQFEGYLHKSLPQPKRRFTLPMAAGIGLLIAMMGLAWFWWQGQQQEAALAALYVPYPGPPEVRGDHDHSTADDPFDLYKEGEYAAALPGLINVAKEDPPVNEVELMVGTAFLMQQEDAQAIRWFMLLEAAESQRLREDGAWYLALAYWRAGIETDAIEIMQTLASSSKYYQAEASEFLELVL